MRKRPRKKKKNYTGKHDSICNRVARELETKPYASDIIVNEEYPRGETDVKYSSDNREVYIEVKCHYTEKGYYKAVHQTIRWENYMKKKDNKTRYGVLYTPETGYVLISKDGKRN